MRTEIQTTARRPRRRISRGWVVALTLLAICRSLLAADPVAQSPLDALGLAGQARLAVLGSGTRESKLDECHRAIATLRKLPVHQRSAGIQAAIADLEEAARLLSAPRSASVQLLHEAMKAVGNGEYGRARRIVLLSPPELGLSTSGVGELVIGLSLLAQLDDAEAEVHLLKAASGAENASIKGAALHALIVLYGYMHRPEMAAAYAEVLARSAPEIARMQPQIAGIIEHAKAKVDERSMEKLLRDIETEEEKMRQRLGD